MKAQDLRIGNWVDVKYRVFNGEGHYWANHQISETDFKGYRRMVRTVWV
jgi:hypothetical protein